MSVADSIAGRAASIYAAIVVPDMLQVWGKNSLAGGGDLLLVGTPRPQAGHHHRLAGLCAISELMDMALP